MKLAGMSLFRGRIQKNARAANTSGGTNEQGKPRAPRLLAGTIAATFFSQIAKTGANFEGKTIEWVIPVSETGRPASPACQDGLHRFKAGDLMGTGDVFK